MSPPNVDPATFADDPTEDPRFGFRLADGAWLERLRAATTPYRGLRLGSYELLGEMRRGAQGVVLRARQPGTGRIIALKRLVHGSWSTPAQRARFERECEAAASLNHPNIVSIYGFEYVDGQPLVAMEWVDGLPIDRWAQGGQSGCCPSRQSVLDGFLKVCGAVQHAHQRGVIHRDLKPGNILIASDPAGRAAGEPKVLDFGLAKRVDAPADSVARLTASQDFLGTPAYAAPEQLRGGPEAVDTRSDVYSLGVVLYELLAGRLPFETGRGVAALFDSIRSAEPPPPSRFAPGLDADLDAIVAKAMAKEPARRYATVDAFAADIRSFRRHEPIDARRGQRGYALRKFVARHRGALVAAAAFVLLLAISAVSIGVLYARQSGALVQANRARTAETLARRAAERIQSVLSNLLVHVAEIGAGTDSQVRRELLADARRMVDAELGDAPAAQAEALSAIGQTYQTLAMYDEAEACLRRALALTAGVAGEESLEVASALNRLGELLQARSQYAEAERLFRAALAIRRKRLADDDAAIAESLHNLGDSLSNRQCFEDALEAYRQAFERRRRVLGECSRETIRSLQAVASAYANLNDVDAAEACLREALSLAQEALGTEDTETTACYVSLGKLMLARGELETAEQFLRHGLQRYREQFGDRHDSVAWAAHRLGTVLHARGEWEEAETLLREARATYELVLGANDPFVAFVCESLAALLEDTDREMQAAELRAEAERIRAAAHQPDSAE